METSPIVQWPENLSVGIKEIDDQHKHFIGIVNKLHESVEKGDVTDELDKIFVELNDYAAFHFETEEKYFEKFHYPKANEHIDEHRKLLEELKRLNEQYAIRDLRVFYDIICYLKGWQENHLETWDHEYSTYFKKKGYI